MIPFDARGNEYLGQLDNINNLAITDARTAVHNLAAANAEVFVDLAGDAVCVIDMRTAAAVLTVVFEGSIDGVNYFPLPAFANQQLLAAAITQEQFVPSVTYATTGNGSYTVGVSGYRRFRVRCSAFTSGGVAVAVRASVADQIIYSRPVPSILHVTVTAAANTAATITLPAAGAGMFHYITNIHCTRNATAILAGTATLIITSTNLPGNPAWSNGNVMVAGGSQLDLNYTPTTPLKSLVANTATTIVMPAAGAAVLNRGNCSYYVGF